MNRNEMIKEIERLEKLNENIRNSKPWTRNCNFYLSINEHEIKRLKKMLDK
jgi:hypothetical protein